MLEKLDKEFEEICYVSNLGRKLIRKFRENMEILLNKFKKKIFKNNMGFYHRLKQLNLINWFYEYFDILNIYFNIIVNFCECIYK